MIDKTGGIITQMARSGAAVSMLVVLASCGGGQTTEQEARRPSARAEAFFKRAEAKVAARKAAIAGRGLQRLLDNRQGPRFLVLGDTP